MKTRAAALLALLLSLPPPVLAGTGFALLSVPDGAEPALEVGVWYPTDATPRPTRIGPLTQEVAPDAPVRGARLPLVVISHGTGGNFASHADTALALAEAGFVVAAPTHTGDNHRDASRTTDLAGRTRHLAAVIGWMGAAWMPGAVDPARLGAFGFSAGGFTVLAAAGGRPELARIGPHCAANPGFYDCRLMAAGGADPPGFVRAPGLRALVVAAPALGFTFTADGLAAVTQPVQLWVAMADAILPPPLYAEAVRAALPRPPEVHRVEGAGHFDLLAPCSAVLAAAAPAICVSAPGFDRAAFHARLNAEMARFLTEALRP